MYGISTFVYSFPKLVNNPYFFWGSSGRGMKAGSYYLCIQPPKAVEEHRSFSGGAVKHKLCWSRV